MDTALDITRDALTGLPDRTSFERVLEEALEQAEEELSPVSLAVVDIDFFGRLNEEHGRAVGDAVLVDLARALAEAFEATGTACRYGGDAMAVVLPGIEKESAFMALEGFRSGYSGSRRIAVEGNEALTLEIILGGGLAASPDDGTKRVDLINKANDALYRAKVSGRNKTCLAREEKMVTKTSHYTQGQLMGLRRLAEREGIGEAVLLREALNDVLRKYNA